MAKHYRIGSSSAIYIRKYTYTHILFFSFGVHYLYFIMLTVKIPMVNWINICSIFLTLFTFNVLNFIVKYYLERLLGRHWTSFVFVCIFSLFFSSSFNNFSIENVPDFRLNKYTNYSHLTCK